ncbi:MAG: hypothetical protein FWD02_00800 [Bacteroidales bacterium]|nr:hypothetical protein [Bacteroidales bacterium]
MSVVRRVVVMISVVCCVVDFLLAPDVANVVLVRVFRQEEEVAHHHNHCHAKVRDAGLAMGLCIYRKGITAQGASARHHCHA